MYDSGNQTANLRIQGMVVEKKAKCEQEYADRLAQSMPFYADALRALKINVPKIFNAEVVEGGVFLACENAGTDFERFLTRAMTRAERQGIVRKIFREVEKIFRQKINSVEPFVVGFDPKPANFCMNQDGAVSYVDLMPPFHLRGGVMDYPLPRSSEEESFCLWRTFTREGILTVLFSSLQGFLERDEVLGYLVQALEEFPEIDGKSLAYQMAIDVFDFEPDIMDMRWPWDIYRARSIGALLAPHKKKTLLARTSFVAFRGDEAFQGVKDLLLRFAKGERTDTS